MNRLACLFLILLFFQILNAQTGKYHGLKYYEKIISTDDGLSPIQIRKSNNQRRMGEFIYSRLWRFNESLLPEADLLDTLPKLFPYDDGRIVLRCRFKENIKWADGRPITIDDVEFTFKFYEEKGSGWAKNIAAQTTVHRIDQRNFDLVSDMKNFPYIGFNVIPKIQVLPKHILEDDTEITISHPFAKKPLASGPFQIDSIDVDKKKRTVYFSRNKYTLENPVQWPIQSIIAISEPNWAIVTKSIQINNEMSYDASNKNNPHKGLDLIFQEVTSKSVYNMLSNLDHLKERRYLKHSWLGIIFNHDRPFISSVDFRRTFDLAIDDRAMIEKLYGRDKAKITTSPFHPYRTITENIIDRHTDNTSDVKAEFAKQGFKRDDISKRLSWVDPSSGNKTSVEFTLIYENVFVTQGTAQKEFIEELVELFRENYGITIKTDGFHSITFNNKLKYKRDEWDLALVDFQFPTSGKVAPIFLKESSHNYSGYKSEILENDFTLLKGASSTLEKKEIMKRIHRHCFDNLPYLILWHVKPSVWFRNILINPTFTPKTMFTTTGKWGIEPR